MKISFKNVIKNLSNIDIKNKKVLAIATSSVAIVLVAVIVITSIVSANGVTTKNGDLMKGIGGARVKNAKVTDGFSEVYANFCLNLLANTDKDKNVAFAPTNIMSAVAFLSHASNSNAKLEVEKTFGMETIELAKQISSIENRIQYNEKKKTGLSFSNNILMNNSIVYRVKKKFLKDNAKYFGLGVDRVSFADKKALKEVFENYTKDANYFSEIHYNVDKLQYMNVLSNTGFSAEWDEQTSLEDTTNSIFQGSKYSTETSFFKFMTDSFIEGGVYKGFTKKLKGNFTFVGLLPNEQSDGAYYGADMILTELSETGQFKNITATADDDSEVAIWLPRYSNNSTATKTVSFTTAINNMGIRTIFEKDAGFDNMADVSSNLHVSEFAASGNIALSPAGACDELSGNVKSQAEKLEKCKNLLLFDHEFVYFIIDDKTGLPVYCAILRTLD